MADAISEISEADAIRIWRNKKTPVVFVPEESGDIVVRIPYAGLDRDDRTWLLGSGRKINWAAKWRAWQLPRGRFNEIVSLIVREYGRLYLIQAYRPLQKCAPACWDARGPLCVCSCLGANHGSGQELEHVVSEIYAFERGERKLACRLLEKKGMEYD
jgi:hypothetical protein